MVFMTSNPLKRKHQQWDDLEIFDPYTVPNNFSCVLYGARGSGKTSWITWFLYFRQHTFSNVYVFSSTAFTGHYQQFLPPHHVFAEYREDVLEMIIDYKKAHADEYVLVILDDVLDSIRDIRKSKALYTVFTMGRHLNIAVMVASQYALALIPAFRRNVDVAVVFGSQSVDTFDQLYREYGMHLSRPEFQALCQRYCSTSYFSCLIVLPTVRSHSIQDVYKFSIANQHDLRPFFIGKKPNPTDDPPPGHFSET